MLKKTFILLIVLLVLFYFYQITQNYPTENYQKINVKLNNKNFALFVADTPEKKEKGLSNIDSLQNNEGMIFVFNKPDYYSFWMKDMRFPLDFIFLKENGIVDLLENIQPQSYPKTFTSKKTADKVIEVKAGTIKGLKIKIGDKIKLL
jgi:uncharacterized membrane protein (UPF0127 family)